MKAGDVLLFIGGNDLIDEGIRLEEGSKFTHAALAISETEFVEAWWTGVRRRSILEYNNVCVFTPIPPLSVIQQVEIIGYALGKIGEEYNFLQLLGFLIEKIMHIKYNPFRSKHKTICSQLVVQAYFDALGIELLPDMETYSAAPSDLANSELLRQEDLNV